MNKLLQINSVANTGSTGRIVEDIGNYVISKGWKSYIAYGRYANNSNSKLIRIGNKIGNYWHVFLTRFFDKHGFASDLATKKLIKKIDKIQPDIIHLHNLHGYYINIKVLFNYLSVKSIPIIWTIHDCWSFTGHCAHFDEIGCAKWKTLCDHCPQIGSYPTSLFLDNSKNNFLNKSQLFNSTKHLTLVPVSYWLNDLLKESFLKKIETRVIHNGLDSKRFSFKSSDRLQKKLNIKEAFILLGVANFWHIKKGLDDFVELSKKLEEDEIIILVGLTEKQINRLPKNIIGVKRTDSIEELCEYYSMADVFLNPTYEDSFGMVNIEALACGTPVIAYNTGGVSETISKDTGYVVNQGSVEDLLEKIILVKKVGKSSYSIACIQRAKNLFEKNIKYLEYFDLYKKKIKQNQTNNV